MPKIKIHTSHTPFFTILLTHPSITFTSYITIKHTINTSTHED